jgi:hypothetical protein
VHADSDIAIFAEVWLGSVKAHPHADLSVCGPREPGEGELRADRCGTGASGAIECDKEPVAGRVDLSAAVRRKRVAEKPPVIAADDRKDLVTNAPDKIR